MACVLWLEGLRFEFYDNIALQAGVIEEQIDEELVSGNGKAELPSDEGESKSKLQEKSSDVTPERALDVAFLGLVS